VKDRILKSFVLSAEKLIPYHSNLQKVDQFFVLSALISKKLKEQPKRNIIPYSQKIPLCAGFFV